MAEMSRIEFAKMVDSNLFYDVVFLNFRNPVSSQN